MEDQIEEILKLTRENNKILRGMRSQSRWSSFFSFVYYVFIISSLVWSYYYIQPMIEPFIKNYENMISGINEVKQNLPNANSLKIDPAKLDNIKSLLNSQ